MFGAIRTKKMVHDGVGYDYLFPNGYGASVVSHSGSYGGERGLWEVMVTHGEDPIYDTDISSDVIGFLTWDGVNKCLEQISDLDLRTTNEKV
ncbi:uncharacterized protein METZ01_LOCUS394996 [marine metagenome]|uniref:Uncharacterized protein n=1 Tax=marine metagenome TaxID=408172 RepID=A0A382V6L8_9ZZZZ